MIDDSGKRRDFTFEVTIDMEAITFNLPMTLALLIAIVAIFGAKRWEIVAYGLGLLLMLHLISIALFILCTLTQISKANPYLAFYLGRHYLADGFLCALKDFLINYAARFEPFLIALYAWVAIRRHQRSRG